MAEQFSDRLVKCDFCESEKGKLLTIKYLNSDRVIAACLECRKRGAVKNLEEEKLVAHTSVPSAPTTIHREKLLV